MRKMIGLMVYGMGMIVMGQTTPPVGGEQAGVTVSEMKVETLKEFRFLHLKQTTTIKGMTEHLGEEVKKLAAVMRENRINARGPLVINMHGINSDPDHPFELEAGFEVEAGVAAPAGYDVVDLPASKSGVALYSGPLMGVEAAYRRVFAGVGVASLEPTGNVREYLLYYEGVESTNNVAMAAVEVK